MHFSLIHPSRGRVKMAEETIGQWQSKLSGRHSHEYILSVDYDDPDLDGYRRMAVRLGVRCVVYRNRSIVDAVNNAARSCSGDVLIVVSDDFDCPELWDHLLAEVIGDARDVAVLVNDCVEGRIMTLPIVGRSFYQRLGYVYHPNYFSMYADDDITEVAKTLGKLVDARHLAFPHRHYTTGHGTVDATYARQNSSRAYRIGCRVLAQRRAAQFGLVPRTPQIILDHWRIEIAERLGITAVKRRITRLLRRATG